MGRRGVGQQKVTLGPGCGYKGTVIHELMHAIGIKYSKFKTNFNRTLLVLEGFGHEQCRPDRDEYVIVDLGQVPQGKQNYFLVHFLHKL